MQPYFCSHPHLRPTFIHYTVHFPCKLCHAPLYILYIKDLPNLPLSFLLSGLGILQVYYSILQVYYRYTTGILTLSLFLPSPTTDLLSPLLLPVLSSPSTVFPTLPLFLFVPLTQPPTLPLFFPSAIANFLELSLFLPSLQQIFQLCLSSFPLLLQII